GYSDIYAIGKKTYQKEKAIELGLDEEKIIDFTDKDKFPGEADVYFECSGTSETLNYAACGLKAGGSIVLVNEADAQLNLFEDSYDRILKKELTIKGSFSSHFDHSEDDDWHYIIRRIEQGLDVEPLITHEFDFNDMIKGLELMRDKSEDYIKVIGKY
ncbi:MAG: hypothetical protein K6F99_10415, partial [Lachnospiraceae bacterium]|nr:hypothetical protein [Lachnospiraceae bacterium]